MKKISVFDTTISDYNLGNQIIMESVYQHLGELFPDDFFFKVPYMEIKRHTIGYLDRSDLIFFGGTNSLSSQMQKYKQWDLNIIKSFFIKDVILMGIGWWQYQKKANWYTQFILNKVLSKHFIHSVRDSHTLQMLGEIGITNVLNTGCPTLWKLSPEHCTSIPQAKADEVIITLTDYNKNTTRDQYILDTAHKNYKKVYYWIQGEGDLDYIRNLKGHETITLINPNLESYDNLLRTRPVDYVGTRLHAGIRALQYARRTIIIGIDNRAIEMQRDFNLPIVNQNVIKNLDAMLNGTMKTDIQLPSSNIAQWKNQFKNEASKKTIFARQMA